MCPLYWILDCTIGRASRRQEHSLHGCKGLQLYPIPSFTLSGTHQHTITYYSEFSHSQNTIFFLRFLYSAEMENEPFWISQYPNSATLIFGQKFEFWASFNVVGLVIRWWGMEVWKWRSSTTHWLWARGRLLRLLELHGGLLMVALLLWIPSLKVAPLVRNSGVMEQVGETSFSISILTLILYSMFEKLSYFLIFLFLFFWLRLESVFETKQNKTKQLWAYLSLLCFWNISIIDHWNVIYMAL